MLALFFIEILTANGRQKLMSFSARMTRKVGSIPTFSNDVLRHRNLGDEFYQPRQL